MQTRSGKVLAQPARPLQAQGTLVEITTSQTGQGTHTRWIRDTESQGERSQNQRFTSPPVSTVNGTTPATAAGQAPLSTPSPAEFGLGDRDFDLSAFLTPEPWRPTSPPRPSPPERKIPRASNISRLPCSESSPYTPSSTPLGPLVLGSAAHERLQASLMNGAKADRPRGRPLVGPTGTFVQTPRPFNTASTPRGIKFVDEGSMKTYPPLPPLVLGSPYGSQEENNPHGSAPPRRSVRSRSPTRLRSVK